jgi:hypothetical protein
MSHVAWDTVVEHVLRKVCHWSAEPLEWCNIAGVMLIALIRLKGKRVHGDWATACCKGAHSILHTAHHGGIVNAWCWPRCAVLYPACYSVASPPRGAGSAGTGRGWHAQACHQVILKPPALCGPGTQELLQQLSTGAHAHSAYSDRPLWQAVHVAAVALMCHCTPGVPLEARCARSGAAGV